MLGRALDITGCNPIVKMQIEAYIKPFLRLEFSTLSKRNYKRN